MKLLIVVPPLVGHINPAVGVAAELTARGHSVAWAGVPELIHELAGDAAHVYRCAVPVDDAGSSVTRPAGLRGAAALKFLWESFLVPLGDAMAPGVAAAMENFAPGVVLCDQQALAGALVSEDRACPWVTSATTSAELAGAVSGMPMVEAWISELLATLRGRLGLAGVADPRFSPHLTLAFTTPELTGPLEERGPLRFVGPSLGARTGDTPFPWEWLDRSRRLVLLTLGTANADAGTEFLRAGAQALSERSDRLQGVVVDPSGDLDGLLLGSNVLVLQRVPQLALLPHVDAVVCHGGHNTVCETLYHGIPLVIAPIRDDQPVVAAQVTAAGAGVRIRFGRSTHEIVGRALDTVLHDPGYRDAAVRLGESFRTAGGVAAAADALEKLSA